MAEPPLLLVMEFLRVQVCSRPLLRALRRQLAARTRPSCRAAYAVNRTFNPRALGGSGAGPSGHSLQVFDRLSMPEEPENGALRHA